MPAWIVSLRWLNPRSFLGTLTRSPKFLSLMPLSPTPCYIVLTLQSTLPDTLERQLSQITDDPQAWTIRFAVSTCPSRRTSSGTRRRNGGYRYVSAPCPSELAGVRPLVLKRQPQPRDTTKANGLGGQILQLLRYQGLLDRFEAASTGPSHPAPRYPFGDVHLDFSHLADPPLHALQLPQPQLERLLDERAGELGADIRRGHEVVGVSQDHATLTADVRGPDGPYRVTARYLVGCDGVNSRVRDMAGIPFPGTTYPEVNRLGQVTVPDSVTLLGNDDLDVPGLGRIRAGFTRTDGGIFGFGPLTPEVLLICTTEDEPTEFDDDAPMTLTELQDSIRRVLGANLPLGEPIRLSRFTYQARQAERYRDGRILLAGDAAHLFPATGAALNAGPLDTVNLA